MEQDKLRSSVLSDYPSLLTHALVAVLAALLTALLCGLRYPGNTFLNSGMDNIAITHQLPKTINVVHKIELDLDGKQLFALQSSIRTLCITTCVVVSISVIAICKYVVNPAITGRNHREHERELRERRKMRRDDQKANRSPYGRDKPHEDQRDSDDSTVALLTQDHE